MGDSWENLGIGVTVWYPVGLQDNLIWERPLTKVSAVSNMRTHLYCRRNFCRENRKKSSGRNSLAWMELHEPVPVFLAFPPPVEPERQQVLFLQDTDDHGKDANSARCLEPGLGRRCLLIPADVSCHRTGHGYERSAGEGTFGSWQPGAPPPGTATVSIPPVTPPAVLRVIMYRNP